MFARALAVMRARAETIFEVGGAALVVGGLAMIYVPAALIVAGLASIAIANLPTPSGRR